MTGATSSVASASPAITVVAAAGRRPAAPTAPIPPPAAQQQPALIPSSCPAAPSLQPRQSPLQTIGVLLPPLLSSTAGAAARGDGISAGESSGGAPRVTAAASSCAPPAAAKESDECAVCLSEPQTHALVPCRVRSLLASRYLPHSLFIPFLRMIMIPRVSLRARLVRSQAVLLLVHAVAGHRCLCEGCVSALEHDARCKQQQPLCPICRAPFVMSIKVHL